jgi:hypothetical protein
MQTGGVPVPARDNAPLECEPPPLTVTIDLQPVAYADMEPRQRAAWDHFWGELVRNVSTAPCCLRLGAEGSSMNQRRERDAVDIEDD